MMMAMVMGILMALVMMHDDDDDIHCDNFVPSCSGDDDGDGGNDAFFPCDRGGGVHGEDS